MMPRTIAECFDAKENNFHLIRLLAALAVIYGHSYVITGVPGADLFLTTVGYKFIGGVAVDIFFVISGFLIASSLERSSVMHYVAARILRIVPALLVCVGITVLVVGPMLSVDQGYWTHRSTWQYLIKNGLLLDTEYQLPGVFEGLPVNGVNGSLWSLPLEFRLYIVFLVLAVAKLMTPGRYSPLAIVTVIVGYFITPHFQLLTQYSNWVSSAAFFLAGGFLWHHRHWITLSYSTLAVLLVACGAFLHADRFGFVYFLTLPYLTLFLAFLPGLPKIHERDLSYGVYLYGWPVAQLVQYFRPATVAWENTLLASVGSLALAFLSWEFVERPALSLKRKFK